MEMHLFQFFVVKVRWLVMQYKVIQLMLCGALRMAWPNDYGRRMALDGQNYGWGFRILFHFSWYREMMNWRHVKRKGSLVMKSILSFVNLGCQRTIHILELGVLMWNTRRAFWSYYQDLSHVKVLFYWKAFGFLAIRKLIMNVHPFLLL
jgi:hypothetical protein